MKPLTNEQKQWVDKTLASLSLEERLAQLLIVKIYDPGSLDQLAAIARKIPYGGLFVWGASADEHRQRIDCLQSASRIPLVVSADLETGAGSAVHGMTTFPDHLAIAAVNDEKSRTIVFVPPMILSSWWLAALNISGYQDRYTP
jgi:beta-N-acetylhexosaminidase